VSFATIKMNDTLKNTVKIQSSPYHILAHYFSETNHLFLKFIQNYQNNFEEKKFGEFIDPYCKAYYKVKNPR
jgi:hypothetical protein